MRGIDYAIAVEHHVTPPEPGSRTGFNSYATDWQRKSSEGSRAASEFGDKATVVDECGTGRRGDVPVSVELRAEVAPR